MTHKTPELLRYRAQISGLCWDEQSRETALGDMNHEKNLKASFLVDAPPAIPGGVAKKQGRAPAEQFSPTKSRGSLYTRSAALPNAIASRLSESGHFLAISRENRAGTCARSVPYAGGLALWRIASLELPHGHPAMEEGVKCGLLRGVQNLGLGALSRADFWAEFARSVFRVQGT